MNYISRKFKFLGYTLSALVLLSAFATKVFANTLISSMTGTPSGLVSWQIDVGTNEGVTDPDGGTLTYFESLGVTNNEDSNAYFQLYDGITPLDCLSPQSYNLVDDLGIPYVASGATTADLEAFVVPMVAFTPGDCDIPATLGNLNVRMIPDSTAQLSGGSVQGGYAYFAAYEASESAITTSTPVGSGSINPVVFEGTYNNFETYDQLIFDIQDLTDSNSQVYSHNLPLQNGTDLPYAFSVPLSYNHSYQYRVRLEDTTGASPDGEWTEYIEFQLTSGTLPTQQLEDEVCTPTEVIEDVVYIPAFGCEIRNALKWAFVPDPQAINKFTTLTLEDRKPFSYIYDIDDLYDELFNAESVGNLDVSVDVPTFGEEPIVLLTQADLEEVPFADVIRALLSAMLYMFTAGTIYRLILKRTHS